ncbi:hypothetical protein RNJ44_03866 [Nakaseomyces bracarensis]|uniref:AAA+ ATPase domain-containing protein n=1 Tax=Nakaseomyces bracarensis TaxID=273131 RepID=A0ABR4NY49_9SACH
MERNRKIAKYIITALTGICPQLLDDVELRQDIEKKLLKHKDYLDFCEGENAKPMIRFTLKHDGEDEEFSELWINNEVPSTNDRDLMSSIVMVRNRPEWADDKPIKGQVTCITTPTLFNVDGLTKFFDSNIGAMVENVISMDPVKYSNSSLADTKRKIRETVLSLYRLNDEIETPQLNSTIHEAIKHAVSQGATAQNYKSFIDEDILEDSKFRNQLRHCLISWTKSISTIAEFTNSIPSGLILDEKNFWQKLHIVIGRIIDQLSLPENQITYNILKKTKISTPSLHNLLDHDIFLAQDKINGYLQFLDAIPINIHMHSGAFLDNASDFINKVFFSLSKFISVNYPLKRVIEILSYSNNILITAFDEYYPAISHLEEEVLNDTLNEIETCLKLWGEKLTNFKLIVREYQRKSDVDYTSIINLLPDNREFLTALKTYSNIRGHLQALQNCICFFEYTNYDKDRSTIVNLRNSLEFISDISIKVSELNTQCKKVTPEIERKIINKLEDMPLYNDTKNDCRTLEPMELLRSLAKFSTSIQSAFVLYMDKMLNLTSQQILDINQQLNTKSTTYSYYSPTGPYQICNEIYDIWSMSIFVDSKMNILTQLFGSDWKKTPKGIVVLNLYNKLNLPSILEQNVEIWSDSISFFNKNLLQQPVMKIIPLENGKLELMVNLEPSLADSYRVLKFLTYHDCHIKPAAVQLIRKNQLLYKSAEELQLNISLFMAILNKCQGTIILWDILQVDIWSIWYLITDHINMQWLMATTNTSFFTEINKNIEKLMNDRHHLVDIEENLQHIAREIREFPVTNLLLKKHSQQIQVNLEQLTESKVNENIVSQYCTNIGNFFLRTITDIIISWMEEYKFSAVTIQPEIVNNSVILSPSPSGIKRMWIEVFQSDLHQLFHSVVIEVEGVKILHSSAIMNSIHHLEYPQNQVLNRIEEQLKLVEEERKNFTKNLMIIFMDYNIFNPNDLLDKESKNLIVLADEIVELIKKIPLDTTSISLSSYISIDLKNIEFKLKSKIKEVINVVLNPLITLNNNKVKNILGYIDPLIANIEYLKDKSFGSIPIKDIVLHYLDFVEKSNSLKIEIDIILYTHKRIEHLEKFQKKLTSPIVPIKKLFTQLQSDFEVLIKEIANNATILEDMIRNEISIYVEQSERLKSEWLSKNLIFEKESLELSIELFDKMKYDTEVILKSQLFINQSIDLFSLQKLTPVISIDENIHSEITNILSDLIELKNNQMEFEELQDISISELIISETELRLREIRESLKCLKTLPDNFISYQDLKNTIVYYTNNFGLLKAFSSDNLEYRHLQKLCVILDVNLKQPPSEIELGDIKLKNISLHLLVSKKLEIEKVFKQAEQEKAIQKSLNTIAAYWENKKLIFKTGIYNIPIIDDWENLRLKINDDAEELYAMKNATYFDAFKKPVENLTNDLSNLAEIINTWEECQSFIIEFSKIFSSEIIKQLLPMESARFITIERTFEDILNQIMFLPLVSKVLNFTNLKATLENFVMKLKSLKQSFSHYLKEQRHEYPRFYFLNDQDLLDILGGGGDIKVISKYLKKIYQTIESLTVEENIISAVKSIEGETLKLLCNIKLDNITSAKQLFTKIDEAIRITLIEQVTNINKVSWEIADLFFKTPYQVILLAIQIRCSKLLTDYGTTGKQQIVDEILHFIKINMESLQNFWKESQESSCNKLKAEGLILELMKYRYHTDILSTHRGNVEKAKLSLRNTMLFSLNPSKDGTEIKIQIHNSEYIYDFNYIGVPEHLVDTNIVMSAHKSLLLSFTQSYGSCLEGPAGTGKTEVIKYLGFLFGKVVTVFNCDDLINFSDLFRILVGVINTGLWVSFDEFNRLDNSVMSSISELLNKIQKTLQNSGSSLIYYNNEYFVHSDTRLFITLNPKYSGRKSLPTNVRKLFRHFNYNSSDTEQIVETLLHIYGYNTSDGLSLQLTNILSTLNNRCSHQPHYDFSLRSMKTILRTLAKISNPFPIKATIVSLLRRIISTRLTDSDFVIFEDTIKENLEEYSNELIKDDEIISADNFNTLCSDINIIPTKSLKKKVIDLFNIYDVSNSIILLGETEMGKTTALKLLKRHMERDLDQKISMFYIDPKVLSKRDFFGYFHNITLEWVDGIFTQIIRKCVNEDDTNHYWIIFDSELDSNYLEALNSMLDDNKLLTLGSGERLKLTTNVKIICETDSVNKLTPATISRSNVIYFASSTIDNSDYLQNQLHIMLVNIARSCDKHTLTFLKSFLPTDLLADCSRFAIKCGQGFHATTKQAIRTYTGLIKQFMIHNLSLFNDNETESHNLISFLLTKFLTVAFTSHLDNDQSTVFIDMIQKKKKVKFWDAGSKLSDLSLSLDNKDIIQTESQISTNISNSSSRLSNNELVPTNDIYLYNETLISLINANHNVILFGPPGSGKTMLVKESIISCDNIELTTYSFSATTTPNDIIRVLKKSGMIVNMGNYFAIIPKKKKKIVLFFDELNLPQLDNMGSHCTSLLIKQLVEQKGFWDTSIKKWIVLNDTVIVGACNPTSFLGRKPLPKRLLKCFTLMYIDYPNMKSLENIYMQYMEPIFDLLPQLKIHHNPIICATLQIYQTFQENFSISGNPRYICSPRELTKLVNSINNSIIDGPSIIDSNYLIKLWLFECWNLFGERLESHSERECFEMITKKICKEHFPNVITEEDVSIDTLLFSSINHLEYRESKINELTNFLSQRFDIFLEEHNINTTFFMNYFAKDIIATERIIRQPGGHGLYIGPPCLKKKTILRFTNWLLGFHYREIYLSSSQDLDDFYVVLKKTIYECIIKDTKQCVAIECDNNFDTSFLERLNDLLANSSLPDIYSGKELSSLLNAMKEKSTAIQGGINDRTEMLNFINKCLKKNLHIFFVVSVDNSSQEGGIINSPTIINRCNTKWFPPWSHDTCFTFAIKQFDMLPFPTDSKHEKELKDNITTDYINRITMCLIEFSDLLIMSGKFLYNSPCYFIDLTTTFKAVYSRELKKLEESRTFKLIGLQKLNETLLTVQKLTSTLSADKTQLEEKEAEARRTLDKMLTDQNEVERKHEATIEIKKILEKQEIAIKEHKRKILANIAEIKPVLDAAQQGVKNIKKEHIIEMRSLNKPPLGVRLILAAVCKLLGYSFNEWKEIQSIIRKDEFIRDIVYFDARDANNAKNKDRIKNEFLVDPNFNYEVINRASKACGPLYNWIIAQIQYSDILDQIEPYENEIKTLETKSMNYRSKIVAAEGMISDLKEAMETSKIQYAELIGEVENRKRGIFLNTKQLTRSKTLLNSLSLEKRRWSKNQDKYLHNKHQLVGNSIIEAATLVYFGCLDENTEYETRIAMQKVLLKNNISFDQNFEFAVNVVPQEIKNKFSENNMSSENFSSTRLYLLKTIHMRIPFVIDAQNDILPQVNSIYERQLTVLSLSDKNFQKKIVKAFEFGGPIIIRKADIIDISIFHRIMNLKRDKDNMKVILLTNSSNVNLPSYIEARINVIDFSITEGSIAQRSLNSIISLLEPTLEEKRNKLEVLHGHLKLELTKLEENLLKEINSSDGAILENDNLILTLEKLKRESDNISEKMLETIDHSKQLEITIDKYKIISNTIVKAFTVIQKILYLNQMSSISPSKILKYIKIAIQNQATFGTNNNEFIVDSLLNEIFEILYSILLFSFKSDTKLVFEILLFELRYRNKPEFIGENETESLRDQIRQLLKVILNSESYILPCDRIPLLLKNSQLGNSILSIKRYFGRIFDNKLTLRKFINSEHFSNILLMNSYKKDGSLEIIDNFEEKVEAVIPLGAEENIAWAEQKLQECSSNGGCIVLQNIELSMEWVVHYLGNFLEQRPENNRFKIIMTINEIPDNTWDSVFKLTDKIYYEGDDNFLSMVKNLSSKYSSFEDPCMNFFLFSAAWMHSVINFKSYYAPYGGFSTEVYFDETDFQFLIQYSSSLLSNGKDQFWYEIRSVINSSIYGSQIESDSDRAELTKIIDKILPTSFEDSFTIGNIEFKCGASHEGFTTMLESIEATDDWQSEWLDISDESIKALELSRMQKIAVTLLDLFED